MNIKLIAMGKTDDKNLLSLIEEYRKRLSFYIKFDIEIIADVKNAKSLSEAQQKEKEGELILSKITPGDHLVLLDENGKSYSSVAFSEGIAEENEFRSQDFNICYWRPVRIFGCCPRKSEYENIAFKNDFFAPDGTFVFYRAIVSGIYDIKE